jgi:hypothetical protein
MHPILGGKLESDRLTSLEDDVLGFIVVTLGGDFDDALPRPADSPLRQCSQSECEQARPGNCRRKPDCSPVVSGHQTTPSFDTGYSMTLYSGGLASASTLRKPNPLKGCALSQGIGAGLGFEPGTGTQSNSLLDCIPAAKIRGRLKVNADLSVTGVPCIWAAGDCAAAVNAVDGEVCPPTAQFAEAQAKRLAANIIAHLEDGPTLAFHYRPKGQLSSVGHNKAVAEIFGLRLSGFIAWLLWRGLYLLRIPTLARKSRLFLEWNWAMFFPPDIGHFGFRRSQRRQTASKEVR